MTDIEFIKRFSKMSVNSYCKKHNINKSNFWHGTAKKEYYRQIRVEIMNDFFDILLERMEDEQYKNS